MNNFNQIPYNYGNLPIPGGGYVTGFAFHPKTPNLLYARTDIGGCYRYDFENDSWISLVEHVTHFDMSETFPLAIALHPEKPEKFYVCSGLGHETYGRFPNGYFSVSNDYGKTFEVRSLPCHCHGNNVGRGTGFRLVVDPADPNRIYFASQEAGLIYTEDEGLTWNTLEVKAGDMMPELDLSFVFVAPNKKTLVVSASGITNQADGHRGHSLFVSYDRGNTWSKLAQPAERPNSYTKFNGFVGLRYDFDGKNLYITLNQTGKHAYMVERGYSCEGGSVSDGYIYKFPYNEDGSLGEPEDITPYMPEFNMTKDKMYTGFGGISSTPMIPGYLIAATVCKMDGDAIFVSKDYGKTWETSLSGLEIGRIHFNAPYMKPEYNGGGSLIHWQSDIKINPFNPNEAFFNTGTGVFGCLDLQSPDYSWSDHCKGIEETVHLNVYAPPKGDILALDIVGDLGGFVFTELDKPCENSFANENNDRYITSINGDYPDEIPNTFVATPRGNWTGRSKGGVVLSTDAGKTLKLLAKPFGLTDEIDRRLNAINNPNTNSGWVSISSDARNIIWSIADGGKITTDCVVYSDNGGESFNKSTIIDLNGKEAVGLFKPFSDRIDPLLAYGFGEDSRFYVSKDGGKTFFEKEKPANLPVQKLSGIDAACIVEIRGISGSVGKFIFAMNIDGLWEVCYNEATDSFSANKLSNGSDAVYCVGLGILPDTDEYINNDKAVYVAAVMDGVFGFYRSLDWCKSWEKINDESQMFGEIKSIDADKKVFGRYFIATGTRGLKYGYQA